MLHGAYNRLAGGSCEPLQNRKSFMIPPLRPASACLLGVLAAGMARADTVTIQPGASIQAAINSNPPGTVFSLPAGVWHRQVIRPKPTDQFIGDPDGGTIFAGDDTTNVLYST